MKGEKFKDRDYRKHGVRIKAEVAGWVERRVKKECKY